MSHRPLADIQREIAATLDDMNDLRDQELSLEIELRALQIELREAKAEEPGELGIRTSVYVPLERETGL